MKCTEVTPMLDALLDNELDMVNRHSIEKHIQTCPVCLGEWKKLTTLQQKIRQQTEYYKAPVQLFDTLSSIEKALPVPTPLFRRRWLSPALAASITLLISIGLLQLDRQSQQQDYLRSEIITGHVRSLMAEHLTDVASSDRHTVKPWFNSRVDFSPTVYDFTTDGFPLVGGRLDYLQNRNVVALVYRRRQHIINLYTWPEQKSRDTVIKIYKQQGYRILSWQEQGMSYWAISDLNMHDMKTFARLIQHKITDNTKTKNNG